jgi:K+ transporter
MAVTGTITITTLLFFYVFRYQWRKPLWVVVIAGRSLLAVDLLFFAANLTRRTPPPTSPRPSATWTTRTYPPCFR